MKHKCPCRLLLAVAAFTFYMLALAGAQDASGELKQPDLRLAAGRASTEAAPSEPVELDRDEKKSIDDDEDAGLSRSSTASTTTTTTSTTSTSGPFGRLKKARKQPLNSSKIDVAGQADEAPLPTLAPPPLAADAVVKPHAFTATVAPAGSTQLEEKSVVATIRSTPTRGTDNLTVAFENEREHVDEHREDDVLEDITDLDDLKPELKEELLKKTGAAADQQQNGNLTPPSPLKPVVETAQVAVEEAQRVAVAEETVQAVVVESSSETAKFVEEKLASTTPAQEPLKVLETTSTDSIVLQQAKEAESVAEKPKEETTSPSAEQESSKPPKIELPKDVKIEQFVEEKPQSDSTPASQVEEVVPQPAIVETETNVVVQEEASKVDEPSKVESEEAKTAEIEVAPVAEPEKPVEAAEKAEEPAKTNEATSVAVEVLEPPKETLEQIQVQEAIKTLENSESKPVDETPAPPTTPEVEQLTTDPATAATPVENKEETPISQPSESPIAAGQEREWNETAPSTIELSLKKEDSGVEPTVSKTPEIPAAETESFIDARLVIDTNDYRPNESRTRPQVTHNPQLEHATKFCTDISPLRDLFTAHIEPLFVPVIDMLPESLQPVLRDQTSLAGLTTASCGLLLAVFVLLLGSCLLVARRNDFSQIAAMNELNETVIVLDNLLKKATFEKQSFEAQLRDLEVRHVVVEEQLSIKEEQLQQVQMERAQKDNSASLSARELEKLKNSEAKLQKELKAAMLELNQLGIQLEQEKKDFQAKLAQAETEGGERAVTLAAQLEQTLQSLNENKQYVFNQNIELEQLRFSEAELTKKLEEKEKALELLQTCLLKEKQPSTANGKHKNGAHNGGGAEDDEDEEDGATNGARTQLTNGEAAAASIDELMKNAELKMRIKTLENELEAERAGLAAKTLELANLENRIREHDLVVEKLKKKQQETEKSLKEQEMQVKLLNELREKDTKQHLKSYADLDAQLKKKASDAEKATHLLDQLRVKQERIQELESQFARIEKQSTLERQTFEKQAHENWLSARKFEKELKETRSEIASLKEKLAEFEQYKFNENTLIRPIASNRNSQQYYMSPGQQQLAAAAKKSAESSPKAPSISADESTSVQANLASTSSIGLDAAANTSLQGAAPSGAAVADQPLQIDTNQLPSSGSLHERPASVSSNPGQVYAPQPPQGTAAPPPYMYNPFIRAPYKMPPYAPPAAYMDQRSSPDVTANAQYFNQQAARMPMAYAPHMYRMYQQQYMQQQQLQQQQQYQLNSSSSQQGSPRPGAGQPNSNIPFSNSFNGSLNEEATASAAAAAETSTNNDHDFNLHVQNDPSNDSHRGNSLNV